MIIYSDFKVTGIRANRFLYTYLQEQYQQKKLCGTSMEVFEKVFKTFRWRIIGKKTIEASLLQLSKQKTEIIKNKNKLFLKDKYNDDVFRLMMRFSLWSRDRKGEIQNWAKIERTFAELVAIIIADLQKISNRQK